MSYEYIDLSREGPIAVLRLNRPDKANAMNAAEPAGEAGKERR